MFRVLLLTQWKWSRLPLLAGAVAAFALPILSVRVPSTDSMPLRASALLLQVEEWGTWYGALAAAVGLLVGVSAWASDHRGGHVYALSLPIERWKYAVYKFGAGAILLLVPVMLMWGSALLVAAYIELPDGLHAYPTALALRFGLAIFVAYGVFFAISAGTPRTAGYVLVLVGGVLAAQLLLNAAGLRVSTLDPVLRFIAHWPGPFEVFTGPWMLIDV